jgi:hypothetical protein
MICYCQIHAAEVAIVFCVIKILDSKFANLYTKNHFPNPNSEPSENNSHRHNSLYQSGIVNHD